MKLPNFIVNKVTWLITGILIALATGASAQRVAVVVPHSNQAADGFGESFTESLSKHCKVSDLGMSRAAFDAFSPETPFNLDADTAKSIGEAAGTEFAVLIKGDNLKRFSFEKKDYFEAYAAIFVYSTRTGGLVEFAIASTDAPDADAANRRLFAMADSFAAAVASKIAVAEKSEVKSSVVAAPPEENTAAFKSFRAPAPYKRISPKYTTLANLYGVAATVDVEVEFDADGRVQRTDVVRWAGFGLDESVIAAIRQMNWRPASISGRNVPIRVLLRYNFKKVAADE